jgi:hypothetical protein
MLPEARYFSFFPTLPLANNVDVGEWIAGTPPADTPWVSEPFKRLAETLLGSFERRRFTGGAMLWHRDGGFDGSKPSDDDIAAIRAAVTFAVLDANDRIQSDDNRAHFMATAENADLFVQPINERDGGITHARLGGLKQIIVAGMKIGDDPPPLPDGTERILGTVPISRKLVAAIFSSVRTGAGAGAVATATEWHRAALSNSNAVSTGQRLIALKTGFESLLHEDDSRKCARLLLDLFETKTAADRDLLPWIGLLWSPTDKTNLQRTYQTPSGKTKTDQRSEIEDWFMALAKARNDVIHNGALTTGLYPPPAERPLSRYAGTLFWKGERVLREAIKATLGAEVLLCGPIAWRAIRDAAIKELEEHQASAFANQAATASVPTHGVSEPERPPRSLAALLAELGCAAANVVVVEALPGLGASRRAVRTDGSLWGPLEVSMAITEIERDLLVQEGAEEELPDVWTPCE